MKKVLYEELLPEECVQRIQEMPVAYLPLGTLEWHGPHMPLGADGIQSKELSPLRYWIATEIVLYSEPITRYGSR